MRPFTFGKGMAPVNTSGAAALGGGEFFWAHTCMVNVAIRAKTSPRSHGFLNVFSGLDNLAQLSSMPEGQPCCCRAGYKNRLWNLPAKQYGEAHRTDQYGR